MKQVFIQKIDAKEYMYFVFSQFDEDYNAPANRATHGDTGR